LKKIKIRKAKKSDKKNILRLVNELAGFENLSPPDKKAQGRLIRDAFSSNPPYNILLAEYEGQTAGYSFYFFTYSSFLARRSLYLEDIYVSEKFRNLGIGKMFFNKLINIAEKNKCARMEWVVLDWNVNAIKFYEKLNAFELKEWKTFRKLIKSD